MPRNALRFLKKMSDGMFVSSVITTSANINYYVSVFILPTEIILRYFFIKSRELTIVNISKIEPKVFLLSMTVYFVQQTSAISGIFCGSHDMSL